MKAVTFFASALLLVLSVTSFAKAAQTMNIQALSAKQRSVVTIASFTANGDLKKLATALNEGLDAGLTVNEIKEVLVQLYAYAGFPRSLNAISTFMGVMDERQKNGIKDAAGKEAGPMPSGRSSLSIGTGNQTKLIGKPVSGPLYDFAPAIDQFLKAHLFGDIFQRDVLDWQTRELATIAALASIGGLDAQLQAHFTIGMNTGLTAEQLKAVIFLLKTRVGEEIGGNAEAVLGTVPGSQSR